MIDLPAVETLRTRLSGFSAFTVTFCTYFTALLLLRPGEAPVHIVPLTTSTLLLYVYSVSIYASRLRCEFGLYARELRGLFIPLVPIHFRTSCISFFLMNTYFPKQVLARPSASLSLHSRIFLSSSSFPSYVPPMRGSNVDTRVTILNAG